MKILKKIIATAVFFILIGTLSAQTNPPTPNDGDDPTTGGNTPVGDNGGGAPIGSGIYILLGLGAVYGGAQTYKLYQKAREEL